MDFISSSINFPVNNNFPIITIKIFQNSPEISQGEILQKFVSATLRLKCDISTVAQAILLTRQSKLPMVTSTLLNFFPHAKNRNKSYDTVPAFEIARDAHVKSIIKYFRCKEVLQGIIDAQRSESQASWGRENPERLHTKRSDIWAEPWKKSKMMEGWHCRQWKQQVRGHETENSIERWMSSKVDRGFIGLKTFSFFKYGKGRILKQENRSRLAILNDYTSVKIDGNSRCVRIKVRRSEDCSN